MMPKTPKPPRTGVGLLTVVRENLSVEYAISFVNEVNGRRGGKGSVSSDPEAMRSAFRAGRAKLTLDDDVSLEVEIVAHSDGSPTAYFLIA